MCVLVCSEKSAKMLFIFGKSHKPNNLYTRHIIGLHLKDAKRKVKGLLKIMYLFLIFNNSFFSILF